MLLHLTSRIALKYRDKQVWRESRGAWMTSFFCQEIRSAHVSVALWIPLKWRLHISHAVSFFNTSSSPVLHLKFWRILDLLPNRVWQAALPPLSFPFPFTSPFRPLPASCHTKKILLFGTGSQQRYPQNHCKLKPRGAALFHNFHSIHCRRRQNAALFEIGLTYVTIIDTKCIDFRMRNSPRSPCSNRVQQSVATLTTFTTQPRFHIQSRSAGQLRVMIGSRHIQSSLGKAAGQKAF